MTITSRIVAVTTYPTIMVFGIVFYYLLLGQYENLQIATYVPIASALFLITLLEWFFYNKREWKAGKVELLNDITYMALVQVLLPRFLSFFVAITLLDFLSTRELVFHGYWPHGLAIFVQVIIMLLVSDFMRYWLHRLAHEWEPLWRLHAVHHSPHRLYWVNVGRFHPLEKSIQYLFDVLPFVILGVSAEVLSLYYVFYSLNGFFQHSNIKLNLGFLNYIVSGPELHRWHHSKLIEESNKNYGNNLIIWDLCFGTWFLPKDRVVSELGLKNRDYPMSFVGQLKTPFIKGIDQG